MAVPDIIWIGVFVEDIMKFQLPGQIPLGAHDKKKIKQLYEKPWISSNILWKYVPI